MNEDDVLELKIIPSFKIYYKNNFGIYKFYSTNNFPHSQLSPMDVDIEFGIGNNRSNKEVYTSTMCGNCQDLDCGVEYVLKAIPEFNMKYKQWQYKIKNIYSITPKTLDQQHNFLKTLITEKQSSTLLEKYPNIVEDIMNNIDIDLSNIRGIKEITFNKIKEKVLNTYGISEILTLLQPLGITFNMIKKLLNNEPNVVLLKQKLLENPYCLTEIHGLGFNRVDSLALKINPDLIKSNYRILSCIKYIFDEVGTSDGHSWILQSMLTEKVKELVPQCREEYKNIIEEQSINGTFLTIYDGKVGLTKNKNIENSIYNMLINLLNAKNIHNNVNLDDAVKQTNKQNGFDLTQEQIKAVQTLIDNNIMIITGRAGAGKTIATRAILNAFEGYSIAMCTLSAKAARRIIEVTNFQDAKTIHRLLGYDKDGFKYNADNKLPYDIILIDEASMINSNIFSSLLCAIKPTSKLVMIFDPGQLPPIGIGNIASDLLSSIKIPIITFNKIHRQAQRSGILLDANMIRDNVAPFEDYQLNMTSGELKDMHYMFRNDKEQINNIAIKAYMQLLTKNSLTTDDIVIITPRKKDCINSCETINIKIQDLLITENVPFVYKGNTKIKLGSKIIQRENDYERNIVNGETGYVSNINEDYSFDVRFQDGNNEKIVFYNKQDVNQIDLAYCLTCHSYQGSQSKKVIVVIDMTHYMLLDACWLYTALTRSINECLCIAEPKAFTKCITDNKNISRQTFLLDIIKNESLEKIS